VSDTPSYLDATQAEIGAWLELPMSKAYAEWVQWEIERGKDAVTYLIIEGKPDAARVRAGQVAGLRYVLDSMSRPARLPDEDVPDDFEDPAKGKR
jgi:hypothetical protein